eukprot:6117821-Prymnesium_polylepis.1
MNRRSACSMLDFGTFAFIAKYRASHGPSLPTAEGGAFSARTRGWLRAKAAARRCAPSTRKGGSAP